MKPFAWQTENYLVAEGNVENLHNRLNLTNIESNRLPEGNIVLTQVLGVSESSRLCGLLQTDDQYQLGNSYYVFQLCTYLIDDSEIWHRYLQSESLNLQDTERFALNCIYSCPGFPYFIGPQKLHLTMHHHNKWIYSVFYLTAFDRTRCVQSWSLYWYKYTGVHNAFTVLLGLLQFTDKWKTCVKGLLVTLLHSTSFHLYQHI